MRRILHCGVFLLIVLACGESFGQIGIRGVSEQPGEFFLGRRAFNPHDKVWGYVWRLGESPRMARLVMLNETQRLAPDREMNQFGVDDHCLYRIHGRFTGDLVYEPNTDRVYPEFLLTGYTLLDTNGNPRFAPAGRGAVR